MRKISVCVPDEYCAKPQQFNCRFYKLMNPSGIHYCTHFCCGLVKVHNRVKPCENCLRTTIKEG